MRIIYIVLGGLLFFGNTVYGQDTLDYKQIGVIKIKKAKLDNIPKTDSPNTPEKRPIHLPVLYYGDVGLMFVAPYVEPAIAKTGDYLIFDFTINERGSVSDINILESNNKNFESLFIKELKISRWYPAKLKSNNQIVPYRFYAQIARRRF